MLLIVARLVVRVVASELGGDEVILDGRSSHRIRCAGSARSGSTIDSTLSAKELRSEEKLRRGLCNGRRHAFPNHGRQLLPARFLLVCLGAIQKRKAVESSSVAVIYIFACALTIAASTNNQVREESN